MATDDVPAPRPRARKPRKFRSDVFRANWSTLVTIVPAIATVMWLSATMPSGERSGLENVAVTYIIYWPLFTVVYLVWTHRAYSTRDRELLATRPCGAAAGARSSPAPRAPRTGRSPRHSSPWW
ncbi:MAG: hypothetical protein R2719_10130 [Micropruina sp.]